MRGMPSTSAVTRLGCPAVSPPALPCHVSGQSQDPLSPWCAVESSDPLGRQVGAITSVAIRVDLRGWYKLVLLGSRWSVCVLSARNIYFNAGNVLGKAVFLHLSDSSSLSTFKRSSALSWHRSTSYPCTDGGTHATQVQMHNPGCQGRTSWDSGKREREAHGPQGPRKGEGKRASPDRTQNGFRSSPPRVGWAVSRDRRLLSRDSCSARFSVSRGGWRVAAGDPRGSSALAARGKAVGARRPCAAPRCRAPPCRPRTWRAAAVSVGPRAGASGGPGPGVTARVVVAEPPGAEMGEQEVVITPAMLAEEEQLEAAGLEKERQMMEKVRGGLGGCGARSGSCCCRERTGTGLSAPLGSCLRETRPEELRIRTPRGITAFPFPLAVCVFKCWY